MTCIDQSLATSVATAAPIRPKKMKKRRRIVTSPSPELELSVPTGMLFARLPPNDTRDLFLRPDLAMRTMRTIAAMKSRTIAAALRAATMGSQRLPYLSLDFMRGILFLFMPPPSWAGMDGVSSARTRPMVRSPIIANTAE